MRVFGIFRGGIESGAASRRVAFVRFWPGENEIFFKKIRPAVDDSAERGNFVVPLNAGLHQSKVRRSVFWRVLGLQIGLNFVPVFRVPRAGRTDRTELSFLMSETRTGTAGSLKSTYRVVNTTF